MRAPFDTFRQMSFLIDPVLVRDISTDYLRGRYDGFAGLAEFLRGLMLGGDSALTSFDCITLCAILLGCCAPRYVSSCTVR